MPSFRGASNREPDPLPVDFLLETNFDDDGAETRAYNNNPPRNNRRSMISVDRYSENVSIHGGGKKGASILIKLRIETNF